MSIFDSIKHKLEHVGDGIKHDIESAGGKAVGEVKSAGSAGVKAVQDEAKSGHDAMMHYKYDALKILRDETAKLKQTLDESGEGWKKIGEDTKDQIEKIHDNAKEIVKEQLAAFAAALTKEGLQKVQGMVHVAHDKFEELHKSKPNLVDAINDLGFALKLGPMTLCYSNFYDRVEDISGQLDKYINDPPKLSRSSILGLVRDLAPTSIDLGISVELSFVIGSNELGVGGELDSISTELALELADVILEKLGVPESDAYADD